MFCIQIRCDMSETIPLSTTPSKGEVSIQFCKIVQTVRHITSISDICVAKQNINKVERIQERDHRFNYVELKMFQAIRGRGGHIVFRLARKTQNWYRALRSCFL